LCRLLRAYGTRTPQLIGNATCYADMGPMFGADLTEADLTEAELRYLMQVEWARTAQDVVWRRSKLGLRLTEAEIAGIDDAMRRVARDGVAAAV
jgi:glycerol-3-phosphate dehydrogenase